MPRALPECRLLLAICLSLLTYAHAFARTTCAEREHAGPPWSRMVVVDQTHPADAALETIFHQVSQLGLGDAAAAHLLKRVGDSLDPEIARRGKAELSLGMLVDAISAAQCASWSAVDMTRFVLALDHVLDEGRPDAAPRLKSLVDRVRRGEKTRPDEVLGNGDTLKDGWLASVEKKAPR